MTVTNHTESTPRQDTLSSLPSSAHAPGTPSRTDWGRRLRTLGDSYALVGVWIAMAVAFAIGMPDKFLNAGSFRTIFGSQSVLIVLAVSVLCTLAIGEFDLSFASVMGISATMLCVLAGQLHVNVVLACVISLLAAMVCGAVNALFVVRFGVSSLVVTLGAGTLLTGIAEVLSHSLTVSFNDASFSKLATSTVFGLPVSVYFAALIALAYAYVANLTALGRSMLFVGSNREVARLAGVRVDLVRAGGYVVSSFFSGLAGILLIAQVGGYDPTSSSVYLLPALAAVFLGTAVVQPGRFNAIGALIGIFFLETGIFGLQLMGLAGWIQDIFYGGGLVAAVSLAVLIRSRMKAA